VVERVLGELLLVDLVLDRRQLGVMPRVGEEDLPGIEGEVEPQEASGRELPLGDAADPRVIILDSLEDADAAARPRPPAVVLVRHVAVGARHALQEHQRIEIEERTGEGRAPRGPPGLEPA
jgi:hypothetical protein